MRVAWCVVLFACQRPLERLQSTEALCTPGSFAACQCASANAGTQQCSNDGQSFGACNCVSVTASPTSATLSTGGSLRIFAATTDAAPPTVGYSVEEAEGGSVAADGLYTAPATPGIYHVRATSDADPTRFARVTLSVVTAAHTPTIVTRGPYVTQGRSGEVASVEAEEGITYDWALINGTITSSPRGPSITYESNSLGLLVLTVYARNQAGETAPPSVAAQQVIAAPAAPVIDVSPIQTAHRTGQSARVTNADAGLAYAWSATGPIVIEREDATSLSFATAGAGLIRLTARALNLAGDFVETNAEIDVRGEALELLAASRTRSAGYADGVASEARLSLPLAVSSAPDGAIFVTESASLMFSPAPGNHTVRRLSVDGIVSTVAGIAGLQVAPGPPGLAPALPRLRAALDVESNDDGTIILDTACRLVLASSTGTLSVYSGNGDCASLTVNEGTLATVTWPQDTRAMARGPSGSLVVAGARMLRRIDAGGAVSIIAGNGSPGAACASDPAHSACFQDLVDLAVDPSDGRVFVIDGSGPGNIRVLAADGSAVTDYTSFSQQLRGIVVANDGRIFVSASNEHVLYELVGSPPSVTLSLVAGAAGVSGHVDGLGAAARFTSPQQLTIDRVTGGVVVADAGNHAVRLVSSLSPTASVSTLIGTTRVAGFQDDAMPLSARFDRPAGLGFDATSRLLLVADEGNHRIRSVGTGGVRTLAGTGSAGYLNGAVSSARFNRPMAVVHRPSDDTLIVADAANQALRSVTRAGLVSTLAGATAPTSCSAPNACMPVNGIGPTARFSEPRALALDTLGNLFVADRLYNGVFGCGSANKTLIRQVSVSGFVTTLAGNGWTASEPNVSGCPSIRVFDDVSGLAADSAGNLLVEESPLSPGLSLPRIHVLTPAGADIVIGATGSTGSIVDSDCTRVRLASPGQLAVIDRNGERVLYVSDGSFVRRFNHYDEPQSCSTSIVAGRFVSDPNTFEMAPVSSVVPGPLPASLSRVFGLVPTADGDLFVGDRGENVLGLLRLPP